ncbi:L-lactate permease [Leucobacter sp. M11]|uniref:L-lactate permease n=1 Tax=Leucobacter sp. M11 TaxID=2993565 RepID=UPI002D7F850D|nr:L-lactate permease [Leucobacter sp. M11]MEB4614816.1 L-lactate permease [Leucobacter sp. M11]
MVGSLALSALCAAIPLIVMFVMLGVFRTSAPVSALTGLALSILLAILVWQMPLGQALSSTAAGAVYGFFPILWILINALWVYKLTVATAWFEVLGRTIRSISNDLRILAVLIGFCFGALLEGLAGFGAPVAITAAMLLAAGMKPIKSAMVALLANTAPVAFGAMGAPIIALQGVTGLELSDLSAMVGRQTPLIALIVPLVLVLLVDGRRGVRQTWPVAIVAGVAFAVSQFLISNYVTVELTDVVAALATVLVVLLFLRVWQPREVIGIETDGATPADAAAAGSPGDAMPAGATSAAAGGSDPAASGPGGATSEPEPGVTAGSVTAAVSAAGAEGAQLPQKTGRPSGREIWLSVAPYLVIMAVFSVAQLPGIKDWLLRSGGVSFRWPGVDVYTADGEPLAAQNFRIDHIRATGSLLLVSGLITLGIYRISLWTGIKVYGDTLKQLRWTLLTVSSVLALAFVMNFSGMTTSLGVALAATGGFFAVLSPVIGWIGVALTGSDTSSNSLFGQLQVTAAAETGLSPVLMAASNSAAGVMGKMLSLQNLAVGAAAVSLEKGESTLFRRLLGWSVALLAVITVLIVLQSTPVLSWMVP